MPFDRSDAMATMRSTGKLRCESTRSISLPTIPVAPTTATFSRLEVGTGSVYFDLVRFAICARFREIARNSIPDSVIFPQIAWPRSIGELARRERRLRWWRRWWRLRRPELRSTRLLLLLHRGDERGMHAPQLDQRLGLPTPLDDPCSRSKVISPYQDPDYPDKNRREAEQ